jgi:hypothetical protein
MKVYLAAMYGSKEKIKEVAAKLNGIGITVTSSWLYSTDDADDIPGAAYRDLMDVKEADAVINFTTDRSVGYVTGGRHVEFGAAWAWGKKLIIVGPKENIFHELEGIVHLQDENELLRYLKKELN